MSVFDALNLTLFGQAPCTEGGADALNTVDFPGFLIASLLWKLSRKEPVM